MNRSEAKRRKKIERAKRRKQERKTQGVDKPKVSREVFFPADKQPKNQMEAAFRQQLADKRQAREHREALEELLNKRIKQPVESLPIKDDLGQLKPKIPKGPDRMVPLERVKEVEDKS